MKSLRLFVGIALLGAVGLGLQGCVSGFRAANSGVTTLQSFQDGTLVPTTTFATTDIICFYVSVTWDQITQDPGWLDAEWFWYKDGKVVAHFENDRANFRGAPNLRVRRESAAALGVGHFTAEYLLDGKQIASVEFDIK
jgi:hypothetical protein